MCLFILFCIVNICASIVNSKYICNCAKLDSIHKTQWRIIKMQNDISDDGGACIKSGEMLVMHTAVGRVHMQDSIRWSLKRKDACTHASCWRHNQFMEGATAAVTTVCHVHIYT